MRRGVSVSAMRQVGSPVVRTGRSWKPGVAVAVNVLLGIPAVVPFYLAWYVLVNGPLADLGWTQREPTENDGMLLWVIFVVPVICMCGAIWGFINVWLRRRTAGRALWYWVACVAALIAPTAGLVVIDVLG